MSKKVEAGTAAVTRTSHTPAIQKPEGKYLLPRRGAQPWILEGQFCCH